VALTDV